MPVAALSLFALALPVLVAGRFGAPAPAPRAQRTPGSLGARAGSSSGTSTALWPLPLSDSRTASCKWTLQGKDVAAVSPDCPYSGHGPDASLEGCQAACVSAGGDVCTTLNWNPTLPDCVFRRCADPAHPNLTATPGYSVFSVQRPAVTAYGLAPQFAFRAAAGGFSNALLEAALARAGAQAFPYGQGQAPSLPGPTLAALEVDVASSDAVLRLGVDESYTIVVDPRAPVPARLAAPTIFGAMRGLETFAQLVSYNLSDASYACEAVQISDAPRFPFRGVMLDTSRHFISVSVIKQVVDMMAAVKLNTLSLHLNDDNSWPLYVPSHPQLSLQGAYSNFSHTYLPEDMKDLVAFAATRGVRVLPEFDSPSHFGTLSQSYPQFAATTQDGSACMVDPSREEVFDFLAAVWGDIAGMFPDAQFRIGGDEFQGCWSDCPAVMAWIRGKWGVNGTVYDAYHYYVRRVINITRGLERSSMAWLDVEGFPDARAGETWAKDYPDVTLNVWTGCYQGNWQTDTARFTQENGTVVISGPFYITTSASPHFTWQQMYSVDLANFTGNTSAALSHVAGAEVCVWDDAAGSDSGDLAMAITPYIFGAAEAWWSPQGMTSGKPPDEMRAHHHRCRLGQRGFASHPFYAFGTWCPREYEVKAYKMG